jgi:hypothetical protein
MPTTPSKGSPVTLLAWTDVATANVNVGTAQDVSTKWAAAFSVRLARRSGTAFTAGWPNVRIEASAAAAGNDHWTPIVPIQMAIGASIANTTLNGAVSAGATSFVVTAATNIAAADVLYLGHTTDSTKWELVRVKSVSGTTITPEEAVTYAHDTGAAVTDQAEVYFPVVSLECYSRVRAVVDNAGGGQTVAAEIIMTPFDSYGV